MNMIVGAATVASASPVVIGAEPDPVLAAIDAHKRAYEAVGQYILRHNELDESLPNERTQTRITGWETKIVETDDPRWIASEREMSRLYDVEGDAECALASIVPTTLQGIMALLQYGADREERGDQWRDDLFDSNDEHQRHGRSWWYFVNRNVVEALREIAPRYAG